MSSAKRVAVVEGSKRSIIIISIMKRVRFCVTYLLTWLICSSSQTLSMRIACRQHICAWSMKQSALLFRTRMGQSKFEFTVIVRCLRKPHVKSKVCDLNSLVATNNVPPNILFSVIYTSRGTTISIDISYHGGSTQRNQNSKMTCSMIDLKNLRSISYLSMISVETEIRADNIR